MNLKAVLLAALAAGAVLFIPACGGGGGGGGGGDSTTNPSNGGGNGSSGSGSGGSSGNTCQPPPPTTIVGGNLFVAEQGPVGMTLVSTGGFTQYSFMFLYDYVFGIPASNPQDKWGQVNAFPPGTPVGASMQVQLQPPTPDLIRGPVPSTFPKGIPLELWLRIPDPKDLPPGPTNSSSTASMGKDTNGRDSWHTASVTYGTNNTATVTFFASGAGTGFTVALTNVFGQGSPASNCM